MIINDNARDAGGIHRALLVGFNEYDHEYYPGPLPSRINDVVGVRE